MSRYKIPRLLTQNSFLGFIRRLISYKRIQKKQKKEEYLKLLETMPKEYKPKVENRSHNGKDTWLYLNDKRK